ncbi:unnamed protein product [Cuscuta epithymum]|uniref:Uncharacterized protein n=1 Tax=Cuscuta epithymum TaxID=186058 RepID=A0AAV0EPE0_9ASTE|nr:unnamed protein product [Cuscuta epithymum]
MPENKGEGALCFSALLVCGDYYHSGEENPRKFFKVTAGDLSNNLLHINKLEPVDVELSFGGGGEDDNVLILAGACRIGSCLYFVGGLRRHDPKYPNYSDEDVTGYHDAFSNSIWCIDTAAATATSTHCLPSLCSTTISCPSNGDPNPRGYVMPLVVPYDGKILIFSERSRDGFKIYDPRLNRFSFRTFSKEILHDREICISYFLWNDPKMPPRKKPLIMFCLLHFSSDTFRLRSYDYELDYWETFDLNFTDTPGRVISTRNCHLIPLEYGSSSLLLIIGRAGIWSLYNMSSKRLVMEELCVPGLPPNEKVPHAFTQECYDESKIVHQFLNADRGELYVGHFHLIVYAKVRLQSEGDKFSASLLSQCSIETGFYIQSYMFVEDSNESTVMDKKTTEAKKDEQEKDLKKKKTLMV